MVEVWVSKVSLKELVARCELRGDELLLNWKDGKEEKGFGKNWYVGILECWNVGMLEMKN